MCVCGSSLSSQIWERVGKIAVGALLLRTTVPKILHLPKRRRCDSDPAGAATPQIAPPSLNGMPLDDGVLGIMQVETAAVGELSLNGMALPDEIEDGINDASGADGAKRQRVGDASGGASGFEPSSSAAAPELLPPLGSLLPCANSRITCYNEMHTALLQCNTAPYLLGAHESSRAACFCASFDAART